MKRIIAIHLYNDYSGSPKVLSQVIRHWAKTKEVHVYSSFNHRGFLSDIQGVHEHEVAYQLPPTRAGKLLRFLLYQVQIFWNILLMAQTNDVIYVNTSLPAMAALAGRLKGSRVVGHIHECSIRPVILQRSLLKIMEVACHELICVSNYLKNQDSRLKASHIIPNSLPEQYLEKAAPKPMEEREDILMVCSLKGYKGVYEFESLARSLPNLSFKLILNASYAEIQEEFPNPPVNLKLVSTQTDLHPHYRRAKVLLNLSKPDQWVETFGLTAIEAMAHGTPIIVPPVGGIAELVGPGENGYTCSVYDSNELRKLLNRLASNTELSRRLSKNARLHAARYSEATMLQSIDRLIQSLYRGDEFHLMETDARA